MQTQLNNFLKNAKIVFGDDKLKSSLCNTYNNALNVIGELALEPELSMFINEKNKVVNYCKL